jgi:hypothetical protein
MWHLILNFSYSLLNLILAFEVLIVSDSERPDKSGPIRSIKMYSYAQCTV